MAAGTANSEPGPAQALFDEGLALLEGDTQPADGPRGIALIDAACEQGHAEAMAMCSLFEAMGAARPQSWERALDRLQQAAEAGSESARGQLRALSERGGAGTSAGSHDWAAIRAAISVERLLAVPERRVLSDSPRIVALPGFSTASECDWVTRRARDRIQPAKVFHSSTGGETYSATRDNSAIEFLLPQMDLVLEVIRARISTATRLPVPLFEPTQVLHYAVGQQFRPHHDFLDPATPGFAEHLRLYGQRIATVLVYLNDGYSGGETAFPKLGIDFRGNAGDALFWTNVDRSGQPDPMTMHAGTPPTAGEKWVVSQWIRDRIPPSPEAAGPVQ